MDHGPYEGGQNLTAGNLGIELASRSIGVKKRLLQDVPEGSSVWSLQIRRFPSLLGEPIFAIYEKAGPEAVLHNRLLLVRGARVALHFCRRVRGCDRARHAAPVEAFDY